MKAEHLRRASRWGGVALTASLVATYAASLGGGFLNYDDPWLIEANPWLRAGLGDALTAFLFDLRPRTRLQLGAEYLPLRDLSMWLDVALFGMRPQAMRAVQLGLYVVACLAFRAAFRRTLGPLRGELWAWLFALHTVHVESVAWLAGRKDVLALLFMGLALWRHARDGRDAHVSVPLLWLAACLSKSMSVGFIGPLLATDLLLGRRPDLRRHGLGAILVGSVLAVHVYVGGLVEMVGGPLEGDRFQAAQVMGEVWLRYARISLDPSASNLRHDIPAPEGWGASLAGWALLLGWGGAALAAWLRGRRSGPDRGSVALAAWLWFAVPLAPVSQVLVPLQNVLADRYLWLSVAGPMLLLVCADRLVSIESRGLRRLLRGPALLWVVLLALGTLVRVPLFADSRRLWFDATARTERDPYAPYQLGDALEAAGREEEAMAAFRAALTRDGLRTRVSVRATNNLAKLLAARGRLPEARALLSQALEAFPEEPKLHENLRKVDDAMEAVARPPRRLR